MDIKVILLTIFCFISVSINSQVTSFNTSLNEESVEMQDTLHMLGVISPLKGTLGRSYMHAGKVLSVRDIKYLLWFNDEAERDYKKGKIYYYSGITLLIGGILGSAYMIDAVNYEYDVNWGTTTAIVLGMYTGGIVLLASSKKKIDNAVKIYNRGLPYLKNSVALNLGVTDNGIGLTLTF